MVSAYPVRLAFVGSLLLSLIAVLGVATIGRDAAYYLDIARQIGEQGPQVAWGFDWPWFILLLAGTHALTHLPLEWCAYLWCAAFMAGTCALLVDSVRQRLPEATGWACLVVLAMPAINQFRNDIIREYGFWFFCSLALWLALRWQARGGWLRAAWMHVAIVAAMLFRLEAAMLFAAFGLWQLAGLRQRANWPRFLQFVALPLLGAVVVLAALLLHGDLSSARVDFYLSMLDPQRVFGAFNQLAQQFGDSLTEKYSRDEAGRIVFFGMLAAILIKFVTLMGPFSLPFLSRGAWRGVLTWLREFQPFAWAGLLYLAILMLFFVNRQFVIGRYISFLNVLVVPALAVGLMLFARRFPRLGKALVVIGLLMMLANVISTGARKTQYIEAGHWIAANIDPKASVFYEDGRISYYAGRGYTGLGSREQATSDAAMPQYNYFALEAKVDDPWLVEWLERHDLRVLASFQNRKKATVVVIGR
jgi:hypothetical protein